VNALDPSRCSESLHLITPKPKHPRRKRCWCAEVVGQHPGVRQPFAVRRSRRRDVAAAHLVGVLCHLHLLLRLQVHVPKPLEAVRQGHLLTVRGKPRRSVEAWNADTFNFTTAGTIGANDETAGAADSALNTGNTPSGYTSSCTFTLTSGRWRRRLSTAVTTIKTTLRHSTTRSRTTRRPGHSLSRMEAG